MRRSVARSSGAAAGSAKVWTCAAPISVRSRRGERVCEGGRVGRQEAEGAELGAAVAGGGDLVEVGVRGDAVAVGVVDAP